MKYNQLLKNKRILITGGAGFVGSHLAKRLFYNNNTVYVLDNYFTGLKKNHIQNNRVKYIKGENQNINNILDKYKKKIKVIFVFY